MTSIYFVLQVTQHSHIIVLSVHSWTCSITWIALGSVVWWSWTAKITTKHSTTMGRIQPSISASMPMQKPSAIPVHQLQYLGQLCHHFVEISLKWIAFESEKMCSMCLKDLRVFRLPGPTTRCFQPQKNAACIEMNLATQMLKWKPYPGDHPFFKCLQMARLHSKMGCSFWHQSIVFDVSCISID